MGSIDAEVIFHLNQLAACCAIPLWHQLNGMESGHIKAISNSERFACI